MGTVYLNLRGFFKITPFKSGFERKKNMVRKPIDASNATDICNELIKEGGPGNL